MTNHRQHVKLNWCEKDCNAFHAFLKGFPKAMIVGSVPLAAF